LWRYGVCFGMFASIARLPLDLVPTHPDRAGGLGFLTLFPMVFVPLIFALSVVMASTALQAMLFADVSPNNFQGMALAWIAVVVLLSMGPLAVFSPKLVTLRETAIVEHSERVSRYNRTVLREWASDHRKECKPSTDMISGLADIGPSMTTIYGIKPVPIEIWTAIPIVCAAAAPMVAVAAVQVPVRELAARVMNALL
jgi:hypothetical protein